MATVHEAVYNILIDSSSNTYALVGTRVYASRAPQDPKCPYVVFHVITGDTADDNTEAAGTLARRTVQVDCVGTSMLSAKNVADATRLDIAGYQGTVGGVDVRHAWMRNMVDVPVPPFAGDETGLHQVSVDYDIMHRQS